MKDSTIRQAAQAAHNATADSDREVMEKRWGKVWDTKTVNMGRQAIEFRSYEPGTTVIEVSSPNAASARIEITTVKG